MEHSTIIVMSGSFCWNTQMKPLASMALLRFQRALKKSSYSLAALERPQYRESFEG
jgi:hypothetical protein